jgi:hypothetical protein
MSEQAQVAEQGPEPKVIRSHRELEARGLAEPPVADIPVTQWGTTYEMAQETRWLDPGHFAVGRNDGSMSIFEFRAGGPQKEGPVIHLAVNSPAFKGVRMVTPMPGYQIATSNDEASIMLWCAENGDWTRLVRVAPAAFPAALGVATSGVMVTGANPRLVVGHETGFLSIWTQEPGTEYLKLERTVDVRNPKPVNPWNDHTIEDVVLADANTGVVAAGSEDGYVTMMVATTGKILSQTVFNPQAQRGINALAINGELLLVANCAVGPTDCNLWYFAFSRSTWALKLLDKANLAINKSLPQVFNFDLEWGSRAGTPCWFSSTEEGALWMGAPTAVKLNPIGYQQLTGPLGSALAFEQGQLAMVSYDLYQFTTDS